MAEYVISEKLYNIVSSIVRRKGDTLPSGFAMGNTSKRLYAYAIDILGDKSYSTASFFADDNKIDFGYDRDLLSEVEELSKIIVKINEMSNSDTKMKQIEEYGINLYEKDVLMCRLRDLKKAKENYLIDLKYYKTEEEINEWSNRFDIAYTEKNIGKLMSILEEVKEQNKAEWIKYINNSSDEDFAFLGHSVSGTTDDLRGKFHSQYISTSLFNKDFNTTFSCRYGYIMSPNKIACARPSDTYTRNAASNNDDLLTGTSVPIISHPKTVLDTLKKHREINENLSNKIENHKGKVYSEVVIDGFEPIGIFCFTNGLKDLDDDYKRALELKSNSPDLDIKIIDVMKYKKGYELEEMKLNVISTLKRKYEEEKGVDPYYYFNYKPEDVPSFDLFFSEFEKLKQKDNYTTEEVFDLYKNNRKLLETNQYELFSFNLQNYTEEEMKYVFDKGYYFNIESILKGTAGFVTVNNLSSLASLKDNEKFRNIASKYYPGLIEFSQLVDKVPLTEEMYNEIKKNPISFSSMNQFLYPMVKKLQDEKINSIKTELDAKKLELAESLNKKEILDQGAEKFDRCLRVESSEYMISIIEADLNQTNNELIELNKDKEYYQNEKDKKSEEYSKLKEKDNIAKELEQELLTLAKHPFINSKKIAEVKRKLSEIPGEEKDNNIQKLRVDMDKLELDISGLNIELSLYENRIQHARSSIEGYQERLKLNFGTTDISEAKKVVSEAKDFIKQYNSYSYSIMEFNIKGLEVEIAELQNQLQSLESGQTINTI